MTTLPFHTGAETIPLRASRPLLIVDADEVLLRFAAGFDTFLRRRGLFLDLVSYRLYGNVKRISDHAPLANDDVTGVLEEFRTELDWLEAVEGARDTLDRLAPAMDIVILSNITPDQAPPRLRNLAARGFDYPLHINAGLKGPAVSALAARAGAPAFFVDDIPPHLASAAEAAPLVFRIHFVGDERLKPLVPVCEQAHLSAAHWQDAHAFIRERL
jgi:hypothetical protein